jgi:hypothetical protein
MKRFFCSLLLLAGLGFACEKADSELTNEVAELENQKQVLAQDLKRLFKLGENINSSEFTRLRTFKKEHPEATTLPKELAAIGVSWEQISTLSKSIVQQLNVLRKSMTKVELKAFLETDCKHYTGLGLTSSSCELDRERAFFNAIMRYFDCDVELNDCVQEFEDEIVYIFSPEFCSGDNW